MHSPSSKAVIQPPELSVSYAKDQSVHSKKCPWELSTTVGVDVPRMYQKEVHYRRSWVRGKWGQNRMQGTNQSIEAGRQPIQVSAGEAGQGRRPGMDDVMFGIATERLKYKWMNCTDSEWKPRKAVSLLAEVPWGDRSSLRGKEPGWIKKPLQLSNSLFCFPTTDLGKRSLAFS